VRLSSIEYDVPPLSGFGTTVRARTLFAADFMDQGIQIDVIRGICGFGIRRAYHGGEESMSGLLEDLKYAFRQVRNNPRLLLLIVLILGIGIGANSTIFSLIEAGGNLPIHDQNTIVLLWSVNPARLLDRTPISRGDFADMKTRLPAGSHWAQAGCGLYAWS
jgi:hypothetical protein